MLIWYIHNLVVLFICFPFVLGPLLGTTYLPCFVILFYTGVDMLDTRLIQVQKKKKKKNGSEKKTYTRVVAFVPAGRPPTDGNGAVRRSVGRSQGTSVPSSGAPHQQGASKSSSVSENLLRNSERKANMNFWVTIGNILLSRPHKRRWLMQSRGYSSPEARILLPVLIVIPRMQSTN